MDLTPDEVTDLIIRAYQRGVEHGRASAAEEQGSVRLHVRPGVYKYAPGTILNDDGTVPKTGVFGVVTDGAGFFRSRDAAEAVVAGVKNSNDKGNL